MKKLFIILFLLGFSVYGAVSTSTFTEVSANSVYYISSLFGGNTPSKYISIWVDYTKGDETSVDMTIAWMPDSYETWGSSDYYIVGERASDETMQNVTMKFDTTGKTFYRLTVPAGVQRMYITTTYQAGSTGTFKVNARKEKD